MRIMILAATGLALGLAGCDNANDAQEAKAPAGQTDTTVVPAKERAREALGEAGEAARATMENLGEAGKAGLDALNENAPEIREGLSNAGERLRNAAGALMEDPKTPDMPGDSELDANETPEALEKAR